MISTVMAQLRWSLEENGGFLPGWLYMIENTGNFHNHLKNSKLSRARCISPRRSPSHLGRSWENWHLEASFFQITLHYNRAEGADALNELRLQTRNWCFLQQSSNFSRLEQFAFLKKKKKRLCSFYYSLFPFTFWHILRCLLMFDRKPHNQKHSLDVEWSPKCAKQAYWQPEFVRLSLTNASWRSVEWIPLPRPLDWIIDMSTYLILVPQELSPDN